MIEYVDKDVQRLIHMISAIKRMNGILAGVTKETFLSSEALKDATAFGISTIGEAAAHVSESFQSAHPEIPWVPMRGIRNRLVHVFDYEQIDYDIVWEVASALLPPIEGKLRLALATIPLPEDFTLPEI